MPFLGVPPRRLDLFHEEKGVQVRCVHSSAGVSTSILVIDGHESLMLDAGDGALRDLMETASAIIGDRTGDEVGPIVASIVEGLAGIVLSHDHFDHSCGLLPILHFMGMMGRRSPFHVVHPEGAGIAEGLIAMFSGRPDADIPFEVVPHVIKGEGRLGFEGWDIDVFEAIHRDVNIKGVVGPLVPALSFVLERRGFRILYSGDTAPNGRLAEKALSCDLAIVEATYPDGKGLPPGVHMTIDDALTVISRSRSGWLVHRTGVSDAAIRGMSGVIAVPREGKP